MKPFVQEFIDFTKDYESPTSFFKWAGYATIAAVMRDNVYYLYRDTKQYPNMYVILLADSAISRKGTPVKLSGKLTRLIRNTKIVEGRSSIQAILDVIGNTEKNPVTGIPIKGGSTFICSEELAAGLVLTDEVVHILTDIYDFKEEYTSRLRNAHGGNWKAQNVCVSMLGASNEEHLRAVYTTAAVNGGLLGRTFIIAADEHRSARSYLDNEVASMPERSMSHLIDQLDAISKLKGRITTTQGARDEYNKWYNAHYKMLVKKPDKAGVLGRIHTGILKLSMVLAVGSTYALEIERNHIEESITECLALTKNYEGFIMSQGKATISEAGNILITALLENEGKMTRKDFLYSNWANVDAEVLDKVISTLDQAGMLKVHIGEQITYELTEKCLERFKEQV